MRHWNRIWFRPAPLLDLAICRVLVVGFQLRYLGLTSGVALFSAEHYAHLRTLASRPDFLYDPLPVLQLLTFPLGLDFRPTFTVLVVVYWVTLISGVAALIGLRTNISLVVFALGNIFLQAFAYSFRDVHHPQALMMIILVVFALSPAGEVLSIDRWWQRRRSAAGQLPADGGSILEKESPLAFWPLLLTRCLFGVIYLDAATSKLYGGGLAWLNGLTLQYYLYQDGLRFASDAALWLAQNHLLVLILSWFTILFEATFFLAVLFPRLAWVYLPTGVAFHLGIKATMRAPFIQFIVIYAVFVPWTTALKWLTDRCER